MSDHDDRYQAVREAVSSAMAEAGQQGWQGYEAQAHIFLAMLDAAEGRDHIAPPAPEPDEPAEIQPQDDQTETTE